MIWEIIIYVFLESGMKYMEMIRTPSFPTEELCVMYTKTAFFHEQLIVKYWSSPGVAYVLPKCKQTSGI